MFCPYCTTKPFFFHAARILYSCICVSVFHHTVIVSCSSNCQSHNLARRHRTPCVELTFMSMVLSCRSPLYGVEWMEAYVSAIGNQRCGIDNICLGRQSYILNSRKNPSRRKMYHKLNPLIALNII